MMSNYRFRRALLSLSLLAGGVVAAALSYALRPEKFRTMTTAASDWLTLRWTELSTFTTQTTTAVVNAIRDVGSPIFLFVAAALLIAGVIALIATIWPSRKAGPDRKIKVGADIAPADTRPRPTFGNP